MNFLENLDIVFNKEREALMQQKENLITERLKIGEYYGKRKQVCSEGNPKINLPPLSSFTRDNVDSNDTSYKNAESEKPSS
ncbi:hypothetical protein MXB_3715 [Myxobolus squamalis]|nr:hypothetical protein MXB_3715 [Myxobolus squamalis]